MATTIPTKQYVTIQYRPDATDGLLGFMGPYTKDAAFFKRKSTQDSWAYGYGVKVEIDPDDDTNITVSGEGQRGGYGGGQRWDAMMLFTANCHPRILDNVLTEGFKVADSVRRCGWNGSGNVKWRIADPRGFELEISSDNFMRIIDCATIENGLIKGKCVWGRDGKDNVLLPEASDVYQEANKRTTQINNALKVKDIQPGDIVDILSKDGADNHMEYLGGYYLLAPVDNDDRRSNYMANTFNYQDKGVRRYIFRKDGQYFDYSTPKIAGIVEKAKTPLDVAATAQEITDWLSSNEKRKLSVDNVALASHKPIKPGEVSMALIPYTDAIVGQLWPEYADYYTDQIICEEHGQYFVAVNEEDRSQGGGYPYPKKAHIVGVNLNMATATVTVKMTQRTSQNYGWYGSRHYYERSINRDDFDINTINKFRLTVSANGITGKIHRMGYL